MRWNVVLGLALAAFTPLAACEKGGPASGPADARQTVGAACVTDADCRLADDTCTGCDCRALAATAADPKCSGAGVQCLVEPCAGKKPACQAGQCASEPVALRRRFPLSLQIAVCMAAGLVVGPLLGARAAPLGELGKLVIQLIKAVATPLLFFSIAAAILETEVRGRQGALMLGFAAATSCVAIALGLGLSNLFHPGRLLDLRGLSKPAASAFTDNKLELVKTLSGYVPANLLQPFLDNLVLSVVMLALLFGFAVRALRQRDPERGAALADLVISMHGITEIVLGWVVRLVPLAVFGVVAKTVGEHGLAPLEGLSAYLGVGLLGMTIQIVVVYQLLLFVVARLSPRRFWSAAREPVVYAMGAGSSLATLPLTLGALDRLGVSRASSALGACVGTNFNNDGIILYEGMAVLFVAQAHGLELSLGQQLVAAGSCLVAAMGVAGVPEAGLVSLALVLNTVGLPLELLPLLLTVDWIMGRARAVTNALSDMVLSIMIERFGRPPPS